jgi:hypothetical protein
MIELKKIDVAHETKSRTSIDETKIRVVLDLVEEGCTIPFIARYRKERTGNLDEVQVAEIIDVTNKIIELDKRKHAILKSLVETAVTRYSGILSIRRITLQLLKIYMLLINREEKQGRIKQLRRDFFLWLNL